MLDATKIKKCSVCENYIRKIEETEQILSGKETVITALQNQLQKIESNYKKLFGDFEKLRFEHSFALQDNFSLKEINSKLEEFTVDNKKCAQCKKGQQKLTQTNQRPKESPRNSVLPLLDEVGNIEKLLKSQHNILKELIGKVIDELKSDKSSGPNTTGLAESFQSIESGDHLDIHPKCQKLAEEIEKLKYAVDECQKENEHLTELLNEKNTLTQCTNISASSDSDVMDKKSNKKDQEISANMAEPRCQNIIAQLKQELLEKEKQFEKCSCELIDQLNDMHNNNQILSDTLAVITAENKNNLEMMNNLKDELNRTNQECEKRTEEMTSRIMELENDLAENKLDEKTLKRSIDMAETEAQDLKGRLKRVMDENAQLKECRCDAEKELKIKLAELDSENIDLRKELTEKTLELTECEEENRNFCQKLDVITNYNNQLMQKIREMEEELIENSKEASSNRQRVNKSEVSTQMSFTEVDELQEQVNQLNEDKKCLAEKCNQDQTEIAKKLIQLECLKTSIQSQMDELEKLEGENNDLKEEIERLKSVNKAETERLQGLVDQSQQQVEMLLKEHDEKTSQIETVANELDTIRRSVTEENENFLDQIRQLEKERDELVKQLEERASYKNCTCDQGRDEIERLNAELIKKQCIIMELEKSIDNFNETFKSFDRAAEELACENACLKSDRERRTKDMDALQLAMLEKIKEIEKLRSQLECAEFSCEQNARAKASLEAENMQLKTQCQSCANKNKNAESENERLKREMEKLRAEKSELERALLDNYQLQAELEALKDDHSRRESTVSGKLNDLQNAYDELKKLFDKSNLENEKLRADIRNCINCKEEAKQACLCLKTENDKLKKQACLMTKEVDTLKEECCSLKKDCAKKCLEVDCLMDTVKDQKWQKRICEENCHELKKKLASDEKEISELRTKLDELQNNCEQKCQEVKKIRKQWESCAKQSQITREEYNNLRKEYKEIKSMLSDQIKRYRLDTGSMEATSKPCQIVKDLKTQIMEKENQMMALQQKLKDASYEIIELKDCIHKLICDNNILKSGINNLIGNLERKIKGPSFGSLASNSAELIAGEILISLTNIEDTIMKNVDGCGCSGKNCDCMSQITSQYNEPQQGPSSNKLTPENSIKNNRFACITAKNLADPAEGASESNTTDSEEQHSTSFLDKMTLERFKGAVQDLDTQVERSMKEKCCGCRDYLDTKKTT